MILTDQMKDFKVYKTKMFLPTLENDKKKKSAIIMLSPSYDSSKKMMNYPLFVNRKRYESYYLDRDVSYYIGSKNVEEIDENYMYLNEVARSELKNSQFGIPEDRKYPLDTKQHVQSAIKLFGHAEESKKHRLARRIATRARFYGIDIPETTQCYKYLHESLGQRLEMPKKCPYCGGIHVAIKMCGEPIFWCTDCDKPVGNVPEQFTEAAILEGNIVGGLETIIFDLGGVLMDHCDRINNLLTDIGIPEDIQDNLINTFWKLHNAKTSETDLDPEAMMAVYLASFEDDKTKEYAKSAYETIATSSSAYEYAEPLLKRLKSEGKKLYYLSNWDQESWDLMKARGKFDILKYFDDGVVSWKAGFSKPSDEIYIMFKEKFKDQIDFSKAVFFDNVPNNIKAARRNGIPAIIWNEEEGPNITEYKNSLERH